MFDADAAVGLSQVAEWLRTAWNTAHTNPRHGDTLRSRSGVRACSGGDPGFGATHVTAAFAKSPPAISHYPRTGSSYGSFLPSYPLLSDSIISLATLDTPLEEIQASLSITHYPAAAYLRSLGARYLPLAPCWTVVPVRIGLRGCRNRPRSSCGIASTRQHARIATLATPDLSSSFALHDAATVLRASLRLFHRSWVWLCRYSRRRGQAFAQHDLPQIDHVTSILCVLGRGTPPLPAYCCPSHIDHHTLLRPSYRHRALHTSCLPPHESIGKGKEAGKCC